MLTDEDQNQKVSFTLRLRDWVVIDIVLEDAVKKYRKEKRRAVLAEMIEETHERLMFLKNTNQYELPQP